MSKIANFGKKNFRDLVKEEILGINMIAWI
jgi:hypothetical protein